MVSDETIRTVLIALLGTGGATFIWTVVKSIIAYRESAEGREDRAVARLEQYEEDCRRQLAHERDLVAYWARCTGILMHTLAVRGINPPDLPQRPPDQSFYE